MTDELSPTVVQEFILSVDGEHATSMFASDDKFIEVLVSNPKVIPYGHLNFTPELGDSWDGEKFVSSTNSNFHTLNGEGFKYEFYCYLVDGKVSWIQTFPKTEEYDLINAVMLSNPQFKKVG